MTNKDWKQLSPFRRLYEDWRPVRLIWGKAVVVRTHWRRMIRFPRASLQFLVSDPETTNFTYDITNREELVVFISKELNVDATHVRAVMAEIDSNDELRAELTSSLRKRPDRKSAPLLGRRIGWYCIVRLRRPRVVVETGVHDGLGSTVLLAALRRNADEGHHGRLIAIDILPGSGWLVPPRLRNSDFHLVIRPSLEELGKLQMPIDLFIHDSDHSQSNEAAEYAAVDHLLSSEAIILSDNAHSSPVLYEFAHRSGRHYSFWRESPANHFYSGGGIGLAFHQ